MSRIFVTGGTGFIGRQLIAILLEQGYDVTLLMHHRNYNGPPHPNLSLIRGDIREPSSWEQSLKACDAIIHLAGSISETSLYRYIRYNSDPTQILAEAASRTPRIRQFIFISSLAAAGPSKPGHPLSEYYPANPVSDYGKSKLMGENRLLTSSGDFQKVILRPPVVYGPGDRSFYKIFQMVQHHIKPVVHHGIQELSLIHVTDLCFMITGLLLNPRLSHDEIFFVNDGTDIHPLNEMFTHLETVMEKWTIPVPITRFMMGSTAYLLGLAGTIRGKAPLVNMSKYRELKQSAWCCKSEKILGFLEYRIKYPLENGFRDTYNWYRRHQWL